MTTKSYFFDKRYCRTCVPGSVSSRIARSSNRTRTNDFRASRRFSFRSRCRCRWPISGPTEPTPFSCWLPLGGEGFLLRVMDSPSFDRRSDAFYIRPHAQDARTLDVTLGLILAIVVGIRGEAEDVHLELLLAASLARAGDLAVVCSHIMD